ncbi:MAG: four helix bundle protein [Flavobacteriaceae bacterium]|jgi:four helix bundle protein|nr:four helix bundle protein [Flavobacteriaceae bacterium]
MSYYKNLHIWQKSMDLVDMVYSLTKNFPKEEIYGLTNQVRRSAVSIPSNIAGGAGRNSNSQFQNFLSYSNGSTLELDIQLIISNRQGYINQNDLNEITQLIEDIQKMNYKLQTKLNGK